MQFFWNRMENDIDTSVDRLADLFDSFLASAVQLCEQTDYRLKTSYDEPQRLLELLILQLAQEARPC